MTEAMPAGIDTPSGATGNGRHGGDLESHDLATLIDGLERRLATQPVIEQSKGILMGHLGIAPDLAFDMLRRWSSRTNLKVRDISQTLVTTATASPPVVPGRASQDVIDLINRLNNGQHPTATRESGQTPAV